MKKRTLWGVFICCLVVYTMGNGFMPLMPMYAQAFGASEGFSGLYVAFAYLCIAVGTMIGGRLSDRLHSGRVLLAAAGGCMAPATLLIGTVRTLWQVMLATGLQWLMAGVCLAAAGAVIGKEAAPDERGRAFGLVGMTIGLGALIGGFSIGPMVDLRGYEMMFTVMAAVILLIPAAALLMVRETKTRATAGADPAKPTAAGGAAERGPAAQHGPGSSAPRRSRIEPVLVMLLLAQVLGMTANGAGNMGRSVIMNGLRFSNTAITTTAAVSGIVALPLPLLLGWLSDRTGRKAILILSYLAGTACLVMLIFSGRLWHFCAAASLLSLLTVCMSVGPAFMTDIVRAENVGTGVALCQSAQWIGMIIGFVYSGYAFSSIGKTAALGSAGAAGIAAAILILLARRKTTR